MEVLPMNKNDNRFTEALASALHKMVERERSGAVDCYGWDYQPKRPIKEFLQCSSSKE